VTDDLAVLTPIEVSRILRVSDVTVRRMIARGVLPRIAGVRVVLIPRAALDHLLLGEYDADSDGRERPRDDRPDEDAEGRRPVAGRRDDGGRATRVADCADAQPARRGAAWEGVGMSDDEPILYRTVDVPVIDGIATLPDGRTVASLAKVLRVPFLTPEDRQRMVDLLPPADDTEDDDLD
jgi:excisionase family DNA binding protein